VVKKARGIVFDRYLLHSLFRSEVFWGGIQKTKGHQTGVILILRRSCQMWSGEIQKRNEAVRLGAFWRRSQLSLSRVWSILGGKGGRCLEQKNWGVH